MSKVLFSFLYQLQRKVYLLSVVIFALCFTFLFSCKKKGVLTPGFDKNDLLGIFSDTSTVITSQRLIDSLATSKTTWNLLGIMNDEVFGITTAGFATQVHLSSTSVSFGNPQELKCDSVLLSLETDAGYGNVLSPISVSVFEISDHLDFDNSYYNTTQINYYNNPIGSKSFRLNFTDSVVLDGSKAAPHIQIKLNRSFGDKILQQGGFSSNDDFLSVVKGIYVVPTNNFSVPSGSNTYKMFPGYQWALAPGSGSVSYIDLISSVSRLTIYYTNTNTGVSTKYQFNITNQCARFTTFQHQYAATPVENALSGNPADTTLLYLQSMAGVSVKIETPYLSAYQTEGKIAINKAELILPVQQGTTAPFGLPDKLVLVAVDSAGQDLFIKDYFESESHYGGKYDATRGAYVFNITRHVHQVVNGEKENYGFYLYVSGRAVNASRLILQNEKSLASPIKLNLIYTKII
ncbi:hypothetical protein FLAV_02411 [Flavobacteriales bacterium]|nr:hypothetical protein [Flavobacteriales bacterium]WKZ75329.1 MAG: DUF4270 domain-containing protein [Vicingaceae bacterium]GIK70731.1 MAG: hypothetical protein BroJett020_20260 [Bacteroidota bacterium]CAG0992988.1 hypothetical protein FLAV_02411 [Flavobacteriales bacterium]